MNKRQLDIERANKIISIVNDYFEIKKEIRSKKLGIVVPRQIAQYFVRKKLKLPYQLIADIYGKNHATMLHSCRKIEESYIYDTEISYYLSDINSLIRKDKELQEFVNPAEKLDEINQINSLIEGKTVFQLRKIKEYLLVQTNNI